MAKGVNKVILIGNLGNDPETKYLPSGSAVTNITVATSEEWKDKDTGQKESRTEWHRVCFFSRLAEIAGEYLRKGSKVYLEGSLRTRKWKDQQGQDRYTTEIVASEMQILDSRGEGGGGYQQPQAGGYQQAPQQAAPQQNYQPKQQPQQSYQQPPQQQRPPQQQAPAPQAAPGMDDFDDDIPF